MTPHQMERLFKAREDVKIAERRLNAVLRAVCPVGSTVDYEKSFRTKCAGTVIEHSTFGEKIRVEASSGARYWVSAYQIFQASEFNPGSKEL